MYKGKKIIVITGGYNEEGKIGEVVSRIPKFADKVIAIDDGSTDNTAKEAKMAGALVFRNRKNMGAGYVLRKGINYAIKNKFDFAVIIAGDNQDNPNEINDLIEPLFNGCDLVQGSRYLKNTKNPPFFRHIMTKLFTRFFSLVVGVRLTDASNGFRAFKLNVVKDINLNRQCFNRYEFEPYLLIYAIKKGYKVKEVPVAKKYDRVHGYSKMKPFIDWYRICKPLFRELFNYNNNDKYSCSNK